MAAFKKANELRGDTFLALLRKIAVDGCYHKNKKNQIDNLSCSGLDDIPESMETKEDFLPEEYLKNKERQAEFLRIISGLPPKQREMIYLYYYAGINTEEIAKLNNCSSVNIRKILYVARNTIKSKIEGQTKTGKYVTGAGVTLTAILLAEGEAFAAECVGIGTAGALGTAGKITETTTAATVTNTVAITAACVIVAGAVFVTAYLTLWQNTEEMEIPEPATAAVALTQVAILEFENPIEGSGEEEQLYIPNNSGYNIYENYQVYETVEPETTRPEMTEPEVVIPPPQPPQVEEPLLSETEPETVDRTREVLAALAGAITYRDINNIITSYGFVLVSEIRSTLEKQYSFYVLNEGSGEIMVGVGIYEDNSPIRIRFEHFHNRQRPTHTIDLRDWIYR